MSNIKGHVYYIGKKVISMLVMMEVRWKVDGKIIGFIYSFVDYVIKEYSGQDHVHISATIQLAVNTVQVFNHASNNIIIHSENACGFASQELIPLIFNMNTRLHGEK